MNNYISKTLFILFVAILFFPFNLKAEILDDTFDWEHLQGSKLGYYVGSFDPIHLGHQNVIDQALESEHIDYILIYPVPGGDQFKNRSDLAIRQKLIASLYQNHPKVLVTYWTPIELQTKFASSSVDLNQYEAASQSLAYLTDRVNMNEGKPQIYGTQWIQEGGKYCLYAVEDIKHLDQRRA